MSKQTKIDNNPQIVAKTDNQRQKSTTNGKIVQNTANNDNLRQNTTKQNPVKSRFAEDVVKDVRADFAERQKQRRPYELSWQLNMNFVMGNQYCGISSRGAIEQEDKYYFWQEKQVFNHIAPIVETRLARLNRVRPKPVVRPFSNSDKDVNSAKLSTKILNSARDKTRLDEAISKATLWSEVCGTSFYKISWNADINDVDITVCSPFEIYPDSNVAQSIDECSSLIHAKVYPVKYVKDLWNVDLKGETVKVFAMDSVGGVGGLGYNSLVPSITQETKSDQVLVIERYTKPNREFPLGKLEIVAGNALLYTGDLPYKTGSDGQRTYPFIRQTSSEQAGCFWGGSVVERVIPVQRAYNAVKCRKHEFLNRLSMGVLTVENGSVDTDSLEEEGLSPGKILVYRQGAEKPELMDNGKVPADFADEENKLLAEFVTVSGVSEFARNSSTPATVTSGVALQLIAEQDDIRLASSIDSVKTSIKNIAKYILRLYKQFVSYSKLCRMCEGNSAEVFYFSSSDIGSDDVVFETENELTDTPATRRTMLFDLLNAGVLTDKDGKLSQSAKAKILSLMGFGNWDNAQDTVSLHIARAEKENLDIDKAEVLTIDDHALHIEEHTRFIISSLEGTDKTLRDKILNHIQIHKTVQEGN